MKQIMIGALLLAVCGLARAGEAKLTVQVDQPGIKVSPLLYGIFFEEINRAGDGGIYAELIQNRSFEDAEQPQAWTLVKGADAEGGMKLDKTQPLNANNPTSLKLDIVKGRVGIANNGFAKESQDGIAVQQGKEYALSLYARGGGELTATLEKADGGVLASQKLGGLDANWKKLGCILQAAATAVSVMA